MKRVIYFMSVLMVFLMASCGPSQSAKYTEPLYDYDEYKMAGYSCDGFYAVLKNKTEVAQTFAYMASDHTYIKGSGKSYTFTVNAGETIKEWVPMYGWMYVQDPNHMKEMKFIRVLPCESRKVVYR